MSFDQNMQTHDTRLRRLEQAVRDGKVRLHGPEGVCRQMEDTVRTFGRPMPAKRPRDKALEPLDPQLHKGWRERGEQARTQEVPLLQQATGHAEGQAGKARGRTQEVKDRLAESRTLVFTQPGGEKRTPLTLWQRVGAAFRDRSLAAFWVKEVVEKQAGPTSTVPMTDVANKPPPDVAAIQAAVVGLRRQQGHDWPDLLGDLKRIEADLRQRREQIP